MSRPEGILCIPESSASSLGPLSLQWYAAWHMTVSGKAAADLTASFAGIVHAGGSVLKKYAYPQRRGHESLRTAKLRTAIIGLVPVTFKWVSYFLELK